MKPHRGVLVVCALLALVLVAGGPAGAASKAKKPKQPKPHASGVWVGQLERHGKHWDYVGQACPIDGLSVCAASVVRYRINPTTAEARAALKGFTGGSGGVWGDLRPAKDKGHRGMLNAKQISTAAKNPPTPGLPGLPGQQGQPAGGAPGSNSTSAP
jgi:hypothetical protein